jgi:hypothetical protein
MKTQTIVFQTIHGVEETFFVLNGEEDSSKSSVVSLAIPAPKHFGPRKRNLPAIPSQQESALLGQCVPKKTRTEVAGA